MHICYSLYFRVFEKNKTKYSQSFHKWVNTLLLLKSLKNKRITVYNMHFTIFLIQNYYFLTDNKKLFITI